MESPFSACDVSDAIDFSNDGMPLAVTQGGSYPDERDDCGVTALALTCDIPYPAMHEICRYYLGRKDGKANESLLRASTLAKLPMQFRCVYRFKSWKNTPHYWLHHYHRKMRLYTFMRLFPKGRYYLEISDGKWPHAISVIDGKIWDTNMNGPDQWMRGAWEYLGFRPQYAWMESILRES